MRQCKDWITSYLKYVEDTEPADIFKRWTAVSTLASVIQRKCYLMWDDFTYPNFYIVLTGPTGCRKSTAMRPAQELLRALGVPLAADAITRAALIQELTETAAEIGDTGATHSSLTVFSKELTVFLGKDNRQMMIDLIDWYDCDSNWRYRTKHVGHDIIPNVWVNILGATTPELFQASVSFDAIGGGLIGRMIFAFAEGKGKIVPFPWLNDQREEERGDLLADLTHIHKLHGQFKITEEVLDFWKDWYPKQADSLADHARLTGYEDRKPKHLLKLAMIMSISKDDELIIDRFHIDEALQWLTDTEAVMQGAFQGLGASDQASVIGKVERIVSIRKTILINQLYQMLYYDISKAELTRIISDLRSAGRLTTHLNDVQEIIITSIEE